MAKAKKRAVSGSSKKPPDPQTPYVTGGGVKLEKFGSWEPTMSNCDHYADYHRTPGMEHLCIRHHGIPDTPGAYEEFHNVHLVKFHRDRTYPGFCLEKVDGLDETVHLTGIDDMDRPFADYDFDQEDDDREVEREDDEDEEGREVFSMDLPNVSIPFIEHATKRHRVLGGLLGLKGDERAMEVFRIVAALVDPITQPVESETAVVSLETVSQVVIALCYDKNSIVADFDLSQKLFIIIDNTLKLLHCHDEVKVRSLNNSDLKVDWKPRVSEWTPHGCNDYVLTLLYMINCVCIYTIYKLYAFHEPDLCLNPFLGYFLKLWKIFTNVVLLGLEVDRRVEQTNKTTPNIIKQVIRGSSAIRYVLASILNDDLDNRTHDFLHLNIIDFMSPYGRRTGSGALYADVRWYVGAMLALGSELNEVVETLVDLEPNDRYDEDVRYMFAHEYENFHHQALFPEEYDEDGEPKEDVIIYEDEDHVLHKVVHQRCTCVFDDDDDDAFGTEGDEGVEDNVDEDDGEFDSVPTAVRSEQDIEFDELGRDWRDVPREGNIFFNSDFKIDNSLCYSWNELQKVFDQMMEGPIKDEIAHRVVMTIANAVKFDFEQNISNSVTNGADADIPQHIVTPDKIYQKWSNKWTFEAMLSLNPVASYAMLDEMFMAHGYRRVLIWFLTHMALSFTLMNYIFELVNGLRGEARISKQFGFSRQGPLVISEVEKSMLLHEFLNNCLIYLSKTYDGYKAKAKGQAQNTSEMDKCVKIVKLICLMMNKLIEGEAIDIEEYRVELISLLLNWIGIIPEAHELFFKINRNIDRSTLDELEAEVAAQELQEASNSSAPQQQQKNQQPAPLRHKKFNDRLKVSLGNVIKKLDNGTLLFRPFFELINQDNGISSEEKKESTETASPALEDTKATSSYIKGSIKPMRRDEDAEHEKVEIAMAEE